MPNGGVPTSARIAEVDITIKTIPHAEQRYETVGDWWCDDKGDIKIRVSSMGDWKKEALVAFHELAEVLLCKDRGITTEMVDAFDMQYEADRDAGKHPQDAEPGDDPACPCRDEHFFATSVERLLAQQLGVDWKTYGDEVIAL
jgi:hypothetical protein